MCVIEHAKSWVEEDKERETKMEEECMQSKNDGKEVSREKVATQEPVLVDYRCMGGSEPLPKKQKGVEGIPVELLRVAIIEDEAEWSLPKSYEGMAIRHFLDTTRVVDSSLYKHQVGECQIASSREHSLHL